MTELLERRVSSSPALPGAEFTPTSLVLPDDLEFDAWAELLRSLVQTETSVQWWIGAAVNHGERIYGETYAQAIEATGLAYQTIANYAWVESAVEPSVRTEELSWEHHKIVAKYAPEEQRAALARAVGEGYTVRELREWLNGEPEPPALPNPKDEYEEARARVERLVPLERVSSIASRILSAAEPLNGRRTEKLRAVPVELLTDLDAALAAVPEA